MHLKAKRPNRKILRPKGSLAFAGWVCVRLGGWTGYYGKPSPIVVLPWPAHLPSDPAELDHGGKWMNLAGGGRGIFTDNEHVV